MSGGVEVDYGAVNAAAGRLDDAAAAVDGTASSTPSGVDAGEATFVVSGFLADFTASAGALVQGLRAAAQGARDSMTAHQAADERARTALTGPGATP